MTRTHALSEGRGGVLVCFDGSEGAHTALWWAATEASARGVPLVAAQSFEWDLPSLHAVDEHGEYNERLLRENAEQDLNRATGECREAFSGLPVFFATPDGPPEVTMVQLADQLDPVMVVAGASGRGALARMVLGSTAAELARRVRQPFVVVRGEPRAADAPVLVGVDGSDNSERAVDFALDFAEYHRAPVRAVYSWTDWPLEAYATAPPGQVGLTHVDESTQALAKEQLDTAAARHPDLGVDWEPVTERPTHALLDRAEGARLLVVGSHGRGPVTRALLGSVSHAVLYHAPCPVAVLRALDREGEPVREDTGPGAEGLRTGPPRGSA